MAYYDNDNIDHKKYIYSVVDYCDEIICNTCWGNRRIAGCLLSVIHTLIAVIFIYIALVINPKKHFYLALFLFLLMIGNNYYFHGCILTRIERSLLNNKSWHGPTSIFNLIWDIDKPLMNKIIQYVGIIPVFIFWIIRLSFHCY